MGALLLTSTSTLPEMLAAFVAHQLPEHFEASRRWHATGAAELASRWNPEAVLRWLERCDFSTTVVWTRTHTQPRAVRVSSYAEVVAGWEQKRTLQINNLHLQLPPSDPLRRLLTAAEQAVRLPIEASNVFVTPPDQRAIPLHLDDFDLLTVQIFGRKDWAVWNTNLLRDCREDAPDELISLHAGSIFYLPACQPHAVVASAETSVSIGCAFRRRMYRQLLEYICQHPEVVRHLDKNLPPVSAGSDLSAGWDALTAALASVDKMKVLRGAMAVRHPKPAPPGNAG